MGSIPFSPHPISTKAQRFQKLTRCSPSSNFSATLILLPSQGTQDRTFLSSLVGRVATIARRNNHPKNINKSKFEQHILNKKGQSSATKIRPDALFIFFPCPLLRSPKHSPLCSTLGFLNSSSFCSSRHPWKVHQHKGLVRGRKTRSDPGLAALKLLWIRRIKTQK